MRTERWYWLLAFCLVSLAAHAGLLLKSRALTPPPLPRGPDEIEVTLAAPEPPAAPAAARDPRGLSPEQQADPGLAAPLLRPNAPAVPIPLPVLPGLLRPAGPVRGTGRSAPAVSRGRANARASDVLGAVAGVTDPAAPDLRRIARSDSTPPGGGSEAPGVVLGGHGGARGPEAPPEDILFNGGGAGGADLPRAPPALGGGGGRSVLSVENPLAREVVPDEQPGLGPGTGGGQGAGDGGGLGFRTGPGIGTRPDGTHPLASLRSKPGDGVGAGQGHDVGTDPPGGGRGTGSELPGTGGSGLGYGRGHGSGFGSGSGDGHGGGGGAARGVPFGVRGGGAGGGGGLFGTGPGGGPETPMHVVYVLDSSRSMGDDDKIVKAKAALKRALGELKPTDSFSVIHFDEEAHAFDAGLLPATPANVQRAMAYIDDVRIHDYTNMSDALEVALGYKGITHVFLLSDGEPTIGIDDPRKLRGMVRRRNCQNARIMTLALGTGAKFAGMGLLRGLALDNDGEFSYIDLSTR